MGAGLSAENKQNLIVEGCYVPFDWEKDFGKEYIDEIRYYCLVMSEKYIKNNFYNIKKYASTIEKRIFDEDCTMDSVLSDNAYYFENVKKHKLNYIMIDEEYNFDIEL